MDAHSRHDDEVLEQSRAEHTTRLIAHLDGALDPSMLDAMSGVWSMLEHAAADAPSHARAVRSRLFWESLSPGGIAAAPTSVVVDLLPTWQDDDDVVADAA